MWLNLIMLVSLVLRLALVPFIYPHHSDEVWQYLEPAYHLIEGQGTITWEQRAGMRSWLIPVLVAVPMRLGHAIDPMGMAHIMAVQVAAALLSLLMVWGFYVLGKRISEMHGLICACVAAAWSEIVYMSPRSLSEPMSAATFVAGTALLLSNGKRSAYAIAAGFLLGLAFLFRIQHGPAIAALLVVAIHHYRFVPVLLGGLLAVLADSIANMALGAPPLQWIWLNFEANLLQARSADYGVQPAWYYLVDLILRWNVFAMPIAILAVLGARRYPAIAAALLVHFVVHSLIPHKEWRFQYLAIVLILLLAALGTGVVITHWQGAIRKPVLLCGAATAWAAASVVAIISPGLPASAQLDLKGIQMAMVEIARKPSTCPIAVVGQRHAIGASYVLLNRPRRIYHFRGDRLQDFPAYSNAVGTIVTDAARLRALPPQFSAIKCFTAKSPGAVCIAQNSQSCAGEIPARYELNSALAASGS